MKKKTTFISGLWSLFISGLLTILPLTLTYALFRFSYKMLKGILRPLYNFEPEFFHRIPLSEFIFALVAIIIVGAIMRIFFLRGIIHWFESLIFRIPLVRPTYAGIKQLVEAFNPHDTNKFKLVVLVEFPVEHTHSIGFVTGNFHPTLSPRSDIEYLTVFIPMTPNPTHGFFVVTEAKRIKVLDISRQEAMALIISGGIIQPERLKSNAS